MGFFGGPLSFFTRNEHCSQLAWTYLKLCLSSPKDVVAFTLGMLSVATWGIAEVPQIITSYKEKSTEGLSVTFLMTWIIGDILNITGCLLEPATLPTQYYTALLYTAISLILTAQTVYYGHIYHRLQAKRTRLLCKSDIPDHEDKLTNKKLTAYNIDERESITNGYLAYRSPPAISSSPILVSSPLSHRYGSNGGDLYYKSARSLSSSPIPSIGSRLARQQDFNVAPTIADSQHSSKEPLLGRLVPTQSVSPSKNINILCVVSSVTFFLGIYGVHLSKYNAHVSSPRMILLVGRKLLQDKVAESPVREGSVSSEIGSYLGWAMTVIYMGGRLPQIVLNFRRGNAEGINPLMFLFALIGNSTYVGSILVKSLEWSKIRPNLPWLVDAGGCALLDVFILIQIIYFRYRKTKDSNSRTDHYILA